MGGSRTDGVVKVFYSKLFREWSNGLSDPRVKISIRNSMINIGLVRLQSWPLGSQVADEKKFDFKNHTSEDEILENVLKDDVFEDVMKD